MRFLFYYPRAMVGDGGPTVTLWAWAGAMTKRGHEVEFVHAGGSETTPLQEPGVSTTEIPHAGKGRMMRPKGLESHLEGVDILMMTSGYVAHNLIAARVARGAGVPYVVIPQGVYDPKVRVRKRSLKRIWELAEVPMLEHALGIHVSFESEIAGIAELAPKARFIVAPTGADASEDAWVGNGGYLAWLGRYDMDHKGLDILLRAMALISPSNRPRLVLHGRDDLHSREEVEQLSGELGLDGAVEVLGPVTGEAKRNFLAQADGFVLPSRWECHSTALLENLAMGVPCLVSSGAHISDSLQIGGSAIVVEPAERELASGLVKLSQADPGLGARARQFIDTQLDWDRVIDSFISQTSALLRE